MNRTAADPNTFEFHRPKLFAMAYRMLGSVQAAEDTVQESWLRRGNSSVQDIDNHGAWLMTTTTRLCLDYLKSARVQREQYIGPWLPEPLLDSDAQQLHPNSEDIVELGEQLSYAVLTLLEKMSPKERAVFVLKEAFNFSHQEIADLIETSTDSSRKLLSRAKLRLSEENVPVAPNAEEHQKLFESFVVACGTGNLDDLMILLAEDAKLTSDGGGVVLAALRPLRGKERLLRFFTKLQSQLMGEVQFEIKNINGQAGLWVSKDGAAHSCISIACNKGLISSIYVVRNPEKLGAL